MLSIFEKCFTIILLLISIWLVLMRMVLDLNAPTKIILYHGWEL